ncbi:MAG: glycosyltransferase family 2 protein [Anaerolineales bacterium]|nr:glycosyltransferase family 2 protein [Anaerolineales bacterium]
MSGLLFSVIICTYNRADLLAQALETVCQQTLPKERYEIIVVDNNSTDHTSEVVKRCQAAYSNVFYYLDQEAGSSHARNWGARKARGQYLAFLDDDCKAPEGWLAVAVEVVDRAAPGVFGGPYYPFYMTEKPKWYKDEYASLNLGNTAGVLAPTQHLSSGNMLIKRSIFEQAKGFRTDLGLVGKQIGYGEDTMLVEWVRTNLPQAMIYYEPRLFVYHLVRAEKMDLSKMMKRRFIHGRYSYLMSDGGQPGMRLRHIAGLLAAPLLFLSSCTLGLTLRSRQQYPYAQNYLYEKAFYWVGVMGRLSERLRAVFKREDRE